jgi:predicted ATPase
MSDVRRRLQRDGVRLVTLTGPGGVGKTRVAIAVAHDLHRAFDAGALFVDLAPVRDAALVLPAMAQALGVRQDDGDVLDMLARALGDQQLLLVLDNFERLLPAGPTVHALLDAFGGLRVLITSRTPLRLSGECVVVVPPLNPRDAAVLFSERAAAVGRNVAAEPADGPAVAAICARLDRLPLAIELAAARSGLLPPRALLRRLDRRLELLTIGPLDAHEHQRTLQATIDWSYELLTESERTLLRRLAVFAGGCDAGAAGHVCQDESALDNLGALLERSLPRVDVRPDGEPRFTMLETIREYASARLAVSGEEIAIRQRHADHVVALAERLEPDVYASRDPAALDLLEVEHDNARAAFDWAHETAAPTSVCDLLAHSPGSGSSAVTGSSASRG